MPNTITSDEHSVLIAVLQASTAGEALEAIPEDWHVFVATNDKGVAAGIVTPGQRENGGVLRRYVMEVGLATGSGETRLAALHAAAKFALCHTILEVPAPSLAEAL